MEDLTNNEKKELIKIFILLQEEINVEVYSLLCINLIDVLAKYETIFAYKVHEKAMDYLKANKPTLYINEEFYSNFHFSKKSYSYGWWKYSYIGARSIMVQKITFIQHLINKLIKEINI